MPCRLSPRLGKSVVEFILNQFLIRSVSAILSLIAGATQAAEIITIPRGKAYVIDGDTLSYAGRSLRLHGIDAPEAEQFCTCNSRVTSCGELATGHLVNIMRATRVTCEVMDVDRYGRLISRCKTSKGEDVSALMVGAGLAFAYRRYSLDYVANEDAAKATESGMWGMTGWEFPWEFRRR